MLIPMNQEPSPHRLFLLSVPHVTLARCWLKIIHTTATCVCCYNEECCILFFSCTRGKCKQAGWVLNWIYSCIRCSIRWWKQCALQHRWGLRSGRVHPPPLFINIKIALSWLIIIDMTTTVALLSSHISEIQMDHIWEKINENNTLLEY